MYNQNSVLNTRCYSYQSVHKMDEVDAMMNISNEELSVFLLKHYDDGNFSQAYRHYIKKCNDLL